MTQEQEHRKQAPQQTNDIERRFSEGMEVRASDTGGTQLRGYAARFNSVYSMGWFTEEVHPDAFLNANLSDVRVLFNHDPNNILGRTKAGTARVGVDNQGLWYEVDLPQSAATVKEAIQRGDITQSSWGFMLRYTDQTNGDKWEKRNGRDHRTLMDVAEVFDASPVTFPANPDTTVAKRSLDMTQQADRSEIEARQREQEDIQTQIDLQIALQEREAFSI
jgi:HK97 family phage prohead protease